MRSSILSALTLASAAYAFPQMKVLKRFTNDTAPVETEITTEFVYLCPTGPVTQETTVTTDLPSGSSYDIIPGWTTTVTKCEVCEDKETEYTLTLPPGIAPVVSTGTAPETTGPTDVPATTTANLEPTEITTEFVYLCPTGPVTKETTVTTDLPAGTTVDGLIPGWTTTVCKCNGCEDKDTEYTLTLPPGIAPEVSTGTEPATTGPTDVPATTTAEDVKPTEITTEFVYLCPTGPVTQETTVTTELPTDTITGLIPGWTTTVTVCTACEDKTKEYTLTLPPGVAPVNPNGTEPVTTETPSATSASATADVTPTKIVTNIEYICPTGIKTIETTIDTELPAASTTSADELLPGWTTTVTICTVCEDKTKEHTFTLPPGVACTGDNEGPKVTGPTSVDTPKASETGATPETSGVPVVDVPTPTGDEDVITTVIKTEYTAVCPTGLTKSTAEVTKTIPATATDTEYTVSMTKTETVCTVCGEKPTTLTLDVPVTTPVESTGTAPVESGTTSAPVVVDVPTPTGGEDVITTVIKTVYTAVCPTGLTKSTAEITKTIPATASASTYTFSMTKVETVCTACGDKPQTLTLEQPVSTPVESTGTAPVESGTTSAPVVVDVPTPTGGEDVITTVIKTVYTAVCPTGLTKSTAEITKTIPATASASTYTFSMTKVETVCTACGDKPQTLTLEQPVSTPVESVPEKSSDLPVVSTSAPVVVDVPSPTGGEDVITTVIKTVYTAVCPTGLTKSTAEITKTIPATASASTYTFSMTKVETVCTACGDKPQTLTLEQPVSTPVESVPEQSSGAPAESTSVVGTTDVPVVDVPTPTGGEDVITTVIKTVYTAVCPTGLTKSTAEITKTIPATASASTYTFSMTKTETVCTVCGAEPTTLTLDVPVSTPEPVTESTATAPIESTPASVTVEIPAISVPAIPEGETGVETVIHQTYESVATTGIVTLTAAITKTVPTGYSSALTVEMTVVKTVCTACAGKPTVDLTVPVAYDTTTIPVPQYSTVVYTTTATNGDIVPGTAVYEAPSSSESAPVGQVVETVVYNPSVSAPAMSTVVTTAVYSTIGSSGLEAATSAITMEVPVTATQPAELQYDTTTTVCANCGPSGAPQTMTLTVPRLTNTLTVTPTSLVTMLLPSPAYGTAGASASAGLGGASNGTDSGSAYYSPQLATPSASIPLQGGDAGRVVVGLQGAVVAGVLAVVALF